MKPIASPSLASSVVRVLVAKTSSPQYFQLAIAEAQRRFPNASIAVWTEERHSEEYVSRSDLHQVILYRNTRTLGSMLAQVAGFHADVIVTQRTFEPAYDKMHFLVTALYRGPGIVLDEFGVVCVEGSWRRRVRSVIGAWVYRRAPGLTESLVILRSPRRSSGPFQQLAYAVGGALIWVARIVGGPFVLFSLLARAAWFESRRDRRSRPGGEP